MNGFAGVKKALMFGLLGAMGCFAGALCGQVFLLWAHPTQQGAETPTPSLIFNQELTERLQREGAKSGDVQISLMWSNENDLDLHCIDPSGEEIYYQHKQSWSSGELDVDMNVSHPYSLKPVENIYWPRGGAPAGLYRIFVNHYAKHEGGDPTNFVVGVLQEGKAQEFSGALSYGEPKRLVYEFTIAAKPDQPSAWQRFWYPALTIGVWTALLAVSLSLALVLGQNRYLHRPLLSVREAAVVLLGGVVAGLVAGGAGQALFGVVAQWESLAQAGRVAGWLILGGLLGRGMGLFIPNLPGKRAAVAGIIGGFLGALAFATASHSVGDAGGRFVGAAILGFFIGLMVALVEAAFREAWLEVRYGPKEIRTVSLGLEPVSIGSDPRACAIYARNVPSVAVRYKLDQGRILCEDVPSAHLESVNPGDQRVIGNLAVTVRTTQPASMQVPTPAPNKAGPAVGFGLRLASGQRLVLQEGVRLSSQELSGLETGGRDGIVAEVVRNPQEPAVLGLKNLSQRVWTARLVGGEQRQIEPGRSLRLAVGTKVSFSPAVEGEIH